MQSRWQETLGRCRTFGDSGISFIKSNVALWVLVLVGILSVSADSSGIFKCKTVDPSDSTICEQCDDGFFYSSYGVCEPCSYPCLHCEVTATNCTQCDGSGQFYLKTDTVSLNGSPTIQGSCQLCSSSGSQPDCAKCSSDTFCTQCVSSSFYIHNGQCMTCAGNCQTCTSGTHCLSCKNHSTYYNTTTSKCDPCLDLIENCLTCLNDKFCLSCQNDAGATGPEELFLNYPPFECISCKSIHEEKCLSCVQVQEKGPLCNNCTQIGYYLNTSQAPVDGAGYCFKCPDGCKTCNDLTDCSKCWNKSFILKNNLCQRCSTIDLNCIECEIDSVANQPVCLKCVNNLIPTTVSPVTDDQYCVSCNQTSYADFGNQTCVSCTEPCRSCTSQQLCISCVEKYYQLNKATQQCQNVCGDSVVVGGAECDSPKGRLHDGCSDKCTQEDNYTCTIAEEDVNGTPLNRSVCSYDNTLTLRLLAIQKEDFENVLTMQFRVTPYLYGLPGTTDAEYTQQQLQSIFQLIDVTPRRLLQGAASPSTVTAVAYDSAAGTVAFTLSYSSDINTDQFQMVVDIGYLRSALNSPYFNTTPSESVYETYLSSYEPQTLIGVYYTEDQYAEAELIYAVSMLIAILSFLAFLVGIFTKEVVGLEMAMLCQFAYVSLLYYEGTLQLPFYAMRSLVYGTGYNIEYKTATYTLQSSNPPQSRALDFDPSTFSNNFNLMSVLYVLPLLIVIPFIPLKAKCIRRLSTIELGHKWVDLLLGEIYLFAVLFNFQWFLVCAIAFYRDGRNDRDYSSTMIIWFGGLATICTFVGLVCKPEIYGNFRTVFRFNHELRTAVLEQKLEREAMEEKMAAKFEGRKKCQCLKGCGDKVAVCINESCLWEKFRNFHSALTYNHYNIVVVFYALQMILLTAIEDSAIAMAGFCAVLTVELIVLRPYGEVSEKLRAVFFSVCLAAISVVRYVNNSLSNGEYETMMPMLILAILGLAVLWTYFTLIRYFYNLIQDMMSDRNVMVAKVFSKETDSGLTKGSSCVEEEEALMRKLMKRYERIELQHNFNDTRKELLKDFEEEEEQIKESESPGLINGKEALQQIEMTGREKKLSGGIPSAEKQSLQKEGQKGAMQGSQAGHRELSVERSLGEGGRNNAQPPAEEQNFKDLKERLKEHKKKRKREELSKKVYGSQMLKMLSLDNSDKYEQEFLVAASRSGSGLSREEKSLLDLPESGNGENSEENCRGASEGEGEQEESESGEESVSYESVEPRNLEEAKEKLDQEKIIMEENQHMRYQRAMRLLSKHGLDTDRNLIDRHYDHI